MKVTATMRTSAVLFVHILHILVLAATHGTFMCATASQNIELRKEYDSLPKTSPAAIADTVINNSILASPAFLDTEGSRIHAHGGGIIKIGDIYHFYGTSVKEGSAWLSSDVNLYTSKDLQSWDNKGSVFSNASIVVSGAHQGPWRIERPKVVFNANTKLYVMWFHLDTESFSLRSVGVAKSNTPTGPFKFVHSFQPDGDASLDMTLFADEGRAYFVRSDNNKFAAVSQLSENYLNTSGICSRAPLMEGNSILKRNNTYWMLGSHLTGWAANEGILARASDASICTSTWSSQGTFVKNSRTTFNSQSTFVLQILIPDTQKTVYMYMGDRWNQGGPGSVGNASYIWLPLVPNGNAFVMEWHDTWRLGDYAF